MAAKKILPGVTAYKLIQKTSFLPNNPTYPSNSNHHRHPLIHFFMVISIMCRLKIYNILCFITDYNIGIIAGCIACAAAAAVLVEL